MDAVTYPTPEVIETLNERLVSFTVNTKEADREGRELLRRYRLLWEPGFLFLDHRGTELRRFVGYRPADEFLAELSLVLGLEAILYARYDDAIEEFGIAESLALEAATAAEALFWSGTALYRRDRDLATLETFWAEIGRRFPDSTWWKRADVLEFKPTGERLATRTETS